MKSLRGFSLVEALVSLAIMGVGLLAVAAFQTDLISGSGTNKARAEALALAQARIEQFRAYDALDMSDDVAAFETSYPDSNSAYVNAESISGNNAAFTRDYMITGSGTEVKSIEVRVGWTDRSGEAMSVALNTQVAWESPRTVGDQALTTNDPVVPSATGRARLGDGRLPDGASTTSNGDGTKLFEDGNELKLAVGDDIVLTLEDACQSGNCIGFVKVKGLVYIDTTSSPNMAPGNVYVKASDAAYCHRYYYDSNGVAQDVISTTTSTQLTANNNYQYFNYTCYLGGGWHGNIGLLLGGGISQSDKICQGDPTSADAWAQPVISARRVYRGMLYQRDADTASGREEDAAGLVKYYSVGIRDQAELPEPGTAQQPHNFVLSSMSVTDTEGSKCITASAGGPGPMMRTDSTVSSTVGALFEGIPTDFVCLNSAYVDSYDTSVMGVDSFCPYDPSDPPVRHHVVTGTLEVIAEASQRSDVEGMTIVSSDGPGNCSIGTITELSGTFTASYSCDVFDWGQGWTGYIEVKPNSDDISCGSLRLIHQTAISSDVSGQDFACSGGDFAIFRGTLTTANHTKVMRSVTITDAGGACSVAADGLSYDCRTAIFQAETWTGSLTFTSTGGVICNGLGITAASSITVPYVNLVSGIVTANFVIANNSGSCPTM